jgi:hypothetical protein
MTRRYRPIVACLLGLWLLALPPTSHAFRTWGAAPVASDAEALNGGGTTATGIDSTLADTCFAGVSRLTGDTVTLSDDGGSSGTPNTWTLIRTQADVGGGGLVSTDLYRTNTPASVGTGHNFSLSGGTFAAIAVTCFAGGATSAIDDQENSAGGGGGASTISTASITPSVNDTIVITSIVSSDGTDMSSIDGGFTLPAAAHVSSTGSNFSAGLAFLVQTTATPANPQWTLNGGATYIAATIASFKTAAAGAAAPCRMLLMGVGCEEHQARVLPFRRPAPRVTPTVAQPVRKAA